MKRLYHMFRVVFAATAAIAPAAAQQTAGSARSAEGDTPGMHDFDFEFGKWRVHHRVKSADGTWKEFDGTSTDRPLMDGTANIEEQIFFRPQGNTYGIALRAFDRKSKEWAIWWLDSRAPHLPMDPPVKGHFEQGVGTFYSESVIDGKTVRTRYIWSHVTATSAQWEQASSGDAGQTWDTNWIMQFRRVE